MTCEQDAVTTLDLLVTLLAYQRLGNKSNKDTANNLSDKYNKNSGISTSVKFLGIQCYGACQAVPSKMKDKLLHMASPTAQNTGMMSSVPFGFWRQHNLYLILLLNIKYFKYLNFKMLKYFNNIKYY
jgi:hypothetical protein